MKKKYRKNIFSSKSGFSLLESMLAIFLATTGIMAATMLISKSMGNSLASRDQTIAAMLAQEGVEIIRNIRDNNWVNGVDSFNYIVTATTSTRPYCQVALPYSYQTPPNGSDIICTANAAIDSKKLYMNGMGFYNHDNAGAATKFSRLIKVADNISTDDTVTIVSMVVWGKSGNFPDENNCNSANQCVYAKVTLTRWGQ